VKTKAMGYNLLHEIIAFIHFLVQLLILCFLPENVSIFCQFRSVSISVLFYHVEFIIQEAESYGGL